MTHPTFSRTWIPIHPHTGGASNRARKLAAQLEAQGGALFRGLHYSLGWVVRLPGRPSLTARTLKEAEGLLLTTKKPCLHPTSPTTRRKTWSAA